MSIKLKISPGPEPSFLADLFACGFAGGVYTRDPNYYDVSVAIGFGFGSGNAVVLLEAPLGTVLAQ